VCTLPLFSSYKAAIGGTPRASITTAFTFAWSSMAYDLKEERAVAKRQHHVHVCHHLISYHYYHTPRTSPCHVTTAMTAGTRRRRLPPPTLCSQSACWSRRGFQPQRAPAKHTHTRTGSSQDHVVTCVLCTHTVTHMRAQLML
jgi:hypothetical protein